VRSLDDPPADLDLERHRQEHARDGLTILRGAIPAALVARLRAASEEIRRRTRAADGPDATRPPGGYIGGRVTEDFLDVDPEAFEDVAMAPRVRAFVDGVLGPDFENDLTAFTLLFHAESREIVQGWHRDYRDNVPWLDLPRWLDRRADLRYFNQFNLALYHDVSLWVVPGSHDRDDTPEEAAVLAAGTCPPWTPEDPVAYSQAADAYIRSMPGATNVYLAPGDLAVYRDSAIHLGHYVPTVTRATLHGHLDDAETRAFFVEHFHDRLRT
jgi:hypothetical protein